MDPTKLKDLVEKMPSPAEGTPPKDGKKGSPSGILSEVDKAEVDMALSEIEAGGRDAVVGLASSLADANPESDSKARHAIHALVTRACGGGDAKRLAIASALTDVATKPAADGSFKPAESRAFLLRMIQRCAGPEHAPAIGKLFVDESLAAPATAALQQIGPAAAETLRKALPVLKGRSRIGVINALGALRDAGSAEALRPLLNADDAATQLAAAEALGRIGDAGAVDAMLKLPPGQVEYRRKLTAALFTLAEQLQSAGRSAESTRVYEHIRTTRTEPEEKFIRESAERAMRKGDA